MRMHDNYLRDKLLSSVLVAIGCCYGYSPGVRMSSIFRIIRTSCVASVSCCFFPIRVSMTCWTFMSEIEKETATFVNNENMM